MRSNYLEYGIRLCDNMVERFQDGIISPMPNRFTYHHGVLLAGMEKISRLANREKYEDFIKRWVDNLVTKDGIIREDGKGWCSLESLDFRQPGLLLFQIYKKTGEERYLKAIKYLVESLKEFPVTEHGSFWHAVYCPNEVWLDGLYMASPIMAMYAKEFNRLEFFDMAANQILTMYADMKDENGLLRHGYDSTKNAQWADPITGLSQEVWGRAMGWFVMAIAEILEYLPKEHNCFEKIVNIEKEILMKLCTYQHTTGRWFQVIDKVEDSRNWLENSATCLIGAALAKALRMGILPMEYRENMEKAAEGVMQTIRVENGQLILPHICGGTCIESGTLEHYYNRTMKENDMHGTGTFLMMLGEIGRL